MQSEVVLNQIKEESAKVKRYLQLLENEPHLTAEEAAEFLGHIERIYRGLSAYTYMIKKHELGIDMRFNLICKQFRQRKML